jgi:hypothetical protein
MRLPFPKHLRSYIPNQWGSMTTGGQAVHGALEDSIYMKVRERAIIACATWEKWRLGPGAPHLWPHRQAACFTWFDMQGMVLIATREVLDEELFVDHRLNPYQALPSWYTPQDVLRDQRTWMQIAGRRPEDPVHPTAESFSDVQIAALQQTQALDR